MATTIGTETNLADMLTDLIQLDCDAAYAYRAAIERLENAGFRLILTAFRQDHLRHVDELGEHLSAIGKTPPADGDIKSFLTQGKVMLGGLVGDKAILQAMQSNEDDTNTAYERAVRHREVGPQLRAILQRAVDDERRHRDWIVETMAEL
jgi:uncharacterized protein (TIGR02284 family)